MRNSVPSAPCRHLVCERDTETSGAWGMGHAMPACAEQPQRPPPLAATSCARETLRREWGTGQRAAKRTRRGRSHRTPSRSTARAWDSLWTYRHWTGACAVRALCAARLELATSSCESTLQAWSIESAHGRSDQIRDLGVIRQLRLSGSRQQRDGRPTHRTAGRKRVTM